MAVITVPSFPPRPRRAPHANAKFHFCCVAEPKQVAPNFQIHGQWQLPRNGFIGWIFLLPKKSWLLPSGGSGDPVIAVCCLQSRTWYAHTGRPPTAPTALHSKSKQNKKKSDQGSIGRHHSAFRANFSLRSSSPTTQISPQLNNWHFNLSRVLN